MIIYIPITIVSYLLFYHEMIMCTTFTNNCKTYHNLPHILRLLSSYRMRTLCFFICARSVTTSFPSFGGMPAETPGREYAPTMGLQLFLSGRCLALQIFNQFAQQLLFRFSETHGSSIVIVHWFSIARFSAI